MIRFDLNEVFEAKEVVRAVGNTAVFGLSAGARAYVFCAYERAVMVCPDYVSANRFYAEICGLSDAAAFLPPASDVLTVGAGDRAELNTRLAALYAFASGRARHLVTTAQALLQLYPSVEDFAGGFITINANAEYRDAAARLAAAGYRRADMIAEPGEFSLRGDILDIYTVNAGAARVDFFGDYAEKIAALDPESLLTSQKYDRLDIAPAAEVLGGNLELAAQKLREQQRGGLSERLERAAARISARLEAGGTGAELSAVLPLCRHSTLFDYFTLYDDTVLVFDEGRQVFDNLRAHEREHNARFTELAASGDVFNFSLNAQVGADEAVRRAAGFKMTSFQTLAGYNHIFEPQAVLTYQSAPIPHYFKNFDELAADLKTWNSRYYRVVIAAGGEPQAEILRNSLADNHLPAVVCQLSSADDTGIYIVPDFLETGFAFHKSRLIVIGTYDYQSRKRTVARSKKSFIEVAVGDIVVHETHGIGRCEGITKLSSSYGVKDYIVLSYRDGDKLYVPIENSDLLTHYSGGEARLSKLGGAEFANEKKKAAAGIRKLAIDLIQLYSEREHGRGFAYQTDAYLMHQFEAAFAYNPTDDQVTAFADIRADMERGKIMDRLLCGDVGYGKTEVAMRAAFLAAMNNKQTAVLAPTTILTEQHFRVFSDRFRDFGIKVEVLNRFRTPSEQAGTLEAAANGAVDIVIGTHRLLSKDVAFKDLGLLILDEEQRFGVAHKEKIKDLKKSVGVLTMTATPIPRTLHMSLSGIRDISTLETPPADRLPVQTFVTEYSDGLVKDALNRELSRGGQAFVVCNDVARIDRYAAELSRLMPGARVSVGHGQMHGDRLEDVIRDFYEGNTDILVCSTIIENGIDLPRANTIIVTDSDRLGLSQLYQLRGRVGRSNRIAYAYFTYRAEKILTEDGYKRLRALMEFTELGSGFKLAMRDLEIRGAGTIMGAEQSGHIQRVGYELYCRMIAQAVKGGEPDAASRECRVDVEADAYIPESFIPDNDGRMRLYARIAAVESVAGCKKLMEEAAGIYGKLPPPVVNLINVGLIKGLGARAGALRVAVKGLRAEITFAKVTEKLMRVVETAGKCVLNMQKEPTITLSGTDTAGLLKFLISAGA